MSAHLFWFSSKGKALAEEIAAGLSEEGKTCELHEPGRLAERTRACFRKGNLLLYVGACGIAVRAIAPLVRDKTEDPAVLVCDDCGTFVISLLSGHIGGANRLAVRIASRIGATTVVTTATDRNGKFAVDEFAARRGYRISDMRLARTVASVILERDVAFRCDLPVEGKLPNGLVATAGGESLGIALSYRTEEPFRNTLFLRPKVLRVGIGCRKGVSAERIAAAVRETFASAGLSEDCIREVLSVDRKAEEEGLLQFCRQNGFPVRFYSAGDLAAVPGEFSRSERVMRAVGVDNVCERAAAAEGDELAVRKTACGGVTVAVAVRKESVRF